MTTSLNQYKQEFLRSEAAIKIREQLLKMEQDLGYTTNTSYSPANDIGTDTSFTDKHVAYLSMHPKVDAKVYLANLRLKTKVGGRHR